MILGSGDHWKHRAEVRERAGSDDGGLTWGDEVLSDFPVAPAPVVETWPASLPVDPISPPNVEMVAPVQAEQLPLPREVVPHPDDLPMQAWDAGLVLVAMQRRGV